MKYRLSSSLLRSKSIKLAFLSLVLALLSVESISAQPGHIPSVEELEKDLQPRFDELVIQIGNDQINPTLYIQRFQLYLRLYQRAKFHGRDRMSFAEKGLADLSTSIELKPTVEAYSLRAGFYQTVSLAERGPTTDQTKAVVDYYLKHSYFAEAESDLLNALRLSNDDEQLTRSYAGLGNLYSTRAQYMATPAAMSELAARGDKYSVWDDFDLAIEYTTKMAKHAPMKVGEWRTYNEGQVARVYEAKARAAYKLGELDIALAAFEAGEKYFTNPNGDHEICNYDAAWGDVHVKKNSLAQAIKIFTKGIKAQDGNCRFLRERRGDAYLAAGDLQKALLDYTVLWEKAQECCRGELSIKRAKIYLRSNEPERARDEIDYALDKTAIPRCPRLYLLRAEAYKRLGNLDRAQADEERASKLGSPIYCVEN